MWYSLEWNERHVICGIINIRENMINQQSLISAIQCTVVSLNIIGYYVKWTKIRLRYNVKLLLYVFEKDTQDHCNMEPITRTKYIAIYVMFVCFITKSILTYPFFPRIPALWTISPPLSSSMCSITPGTANVGSSYNRMRGPGIGCWFSDRSNCSHWSLTLTFTLISENLSLYTTQLLVLVLIQLCSPRCWHRDSNYCRTGCRQSQLRFVLSPLLFRPRLLGIMIYWLFPQN